MVSDVSGPSVQDPSRDVPAAPSACLLGQMLIAQGLVSAPDLERGLAFQARFGGRLGGILVRIGALSESDLLAVLSEQLGFPILAGGGLPSDPALILATIERSGHPPEWWLDQEAIVWEELDEGCIHCVARVGKSRRRSTAARSSSATARASSGAASRLAAATASCTARLMPTPPIGDIA